MSQPWLSAIDWTRPWLAPFRETAGLLLEGGCWRTAANLLAALRGLRNQQGFPIVFVDQAELSNGVAYETFIGRTGQVPTRENLHDFFNALAWLTHPLAKASLNAVQAGEIDRLSSPLALAPAQASKLDACSSTRGLLRDRATLFDENAGLLLASEESIEIALRQHDWQQALVARRAAFGTCCEIRLFGHALIEKLVSPYKAITAHVWVLPVQQQFFALDDDERRQQVDMLLAGEIGGGLLGVPAMALPVLGVPGWWSPQDSAFYDDRTVFRPKRSA
ncbi:MAG: DUF3025 domain-containing protein [Herminiimonas sp.]|nr:DUF3025 domain-containing protein [Herminiimonas sp.]